MNSYQEDLKALEGSNSEMNIKSLKIHLKKTHLYLIYMWVKNKLYPIELEKAQVIRSKPMNKCTQDFLLDNKKVIVSLTSFPDRIPYIHKCLYSLMNQKYKPNMLILWLSEKQFPNKDKDLPNSVLELKEKGLSIFWVKEDIGSYKKLIPTLKRYPNDIIVTADDDLYYPSDWLENLVDAYKKNPYCIHSTLITRLAIKDNTIDSIECEKKMKNSISYYNKLLGGSGTLYPPHSLDEEVMNEEVFTTISKTSDDIWFWAMAVLNKTKIHWIENGMKKIYFVEQMQDKTPCLWKVNDEGEQLFEKHINAVARKYELFNILQEEI